MKTKNISVEAALTISTGRMLCSFDELNTALDFLTGDTLFTHQLPRAFKPCSEWLKARFPELKFADLKLSCLDDYLDRFSGTKDKAVRMWVDELLAIGLRGSYDVQPLPDGVFQHEDPVAELARLLGPGSEDRIMIVETP